MSAQHTPGPWELHLLGKGRIPVAIVVHRDGGTTSVLYPPQTPSERTPADMRLAAAAPELLAAAERALTYIANTESEFDITLGSGDALRAAIAKAKGGAS